MFPTSKNKKKLYFYNMIMDLNVSVYAIVVCLFFIILIAVNTVFEPFENITLRGISGTSGKPSQSKETVNISNPFIKYNVSSAEETKMQTTKTLQDELAEKNQKYLDNKVQIYNQLLVEENKDVAFFYNDVFDQSGITEDADDVVNMRDKVDYSNVKTGLDKCKENCPNGICVGIGYSGVAQCIPLPEKTFDWGTLYKNTEFTEGLEIPNDNTNYQYF